MREPYLFVDFGVTLRHFSSGPASPTAIARFGGPMISSSSVAGGGGDHTGGLDGAFDFDERVGVGFAHGLYIAFDLELGNFAWRRGDSLSLIHI